MAAGWRTAFAFGAGTALQDLREALRTRFAADAVQLVDSGTAALTLALTAVLRRRPGTAVALPAYSCYDLATAAAAADMSVVLYDVDPATLGPDWPSLERAVLAGASAIVVANLHGIPIDLTRVADIARARDAWIIEDAAQGAGAWWQGARIGSHGMLSVLSFGRGKGVTGGGGGALLGRAAGAELMDVDGLRPAGGVVRALTALGAQWLLARRYAYAIPAALPFLHLGETRYREPRPPAALAPGLAAVALGALALDDAEAAMRRVRAERYTQVAGSHGLPSVVVPAASVPGYLRYPLLVPRAVAQAPTSLGVMRGYPRALADLPPLAARCRNRAEDFPGARALAARLCTLPTHSRATERDVAAVLEWIRAQR